MTSVPQALIELLMRENAPLLAGPKRGEEIFEGTDYPRTWNGFIGQDRAKEQLMILVGSARARGVRLEHTLFASGIAGVGKTTLATLLAYSAGVGLVQTTGPLSMLDARDLMRGMNDRDVLFIDEIHLLVAGNKNRADWILPFLTEGKLYTDRGAETMPNITVVGATTDVGKLPATLISRFMSQPTIVPYSTEEAGQIALNLAGRMGIKIPRNAAPAIAQAADHNPRVMRMILTSIRDLNFAYPDTHPNLDKAFEWSGVSRDGLSQVARDVLVLLLSSRDYTASIDSVRAHLGEPGPIKQHERMLLQRQLVTVTGRGRKLTDLGVTRAIEKARRLSQSA